MVQAQSKQSEETIGVATREADGTFVLQLRTPAESGVIGDALIRYPPTDPHYGEILRHLGEVPVGKWVPVKPFPDR